MRWASAASISSSVVAILVAGVSSGCGSSSRAADTLSPCELAAETAAAAHVAWEAYNAGSLGTQASLAAWFKGVPRARYLDAAGRLRPLSAVHGDAHWDYETWMAHLEGKSVDGIGAQMYKARMQVRHDGSANC